MLLIIMFILRQVREVTGATVRRNMSNITDRRTAPIHGGSHTYIHTHTKTVKKTHPHVQIQTQLEKREGERERRVHPRK